MAKNDGFLRITLNVPRVSSDSYFVELASLAPYQRAKRVHALARMALAIERSGFALDPAKTTSSPTEPKPSNDTASPEGNQAPTASAPPTEPAVAEVEAYVPELDQLWEHGIMGEP